MLSISIERRLCSTPLAFSAATIRRDLPGGVLNHFGNPTRNLARHLITNINSRSRWISQLKGVRH